MKKCSKLSEKQGCLKHFKWVRLSHSSLLKCRPLHFHLHSGNTAKLLESLGHKTLKYTLNAGAELEYSKFIVGIPMIQLAEYEQMLTYCYAVAGPRPVSAERSHSS